MISIVEDQDSDIIVSELFERNVLPNSANILVTGAGGFLGSQIIIALNKIARENPRVKVSSIDNFIRPEFRKLNLDNINFEERDVCKPWIGNFSYTHILHLASIASPIYYRKFPLQTLLSNFEGTKNVLDLSLKSNAKVLLMSSSEIYGDPVEAHIPTDESYRGNVSSVGPRSCYDEGKRVMETLGWIYNSEFNSRIAIARPFNFYGPGMRIDDKRVIPDFLNSIVNDLDLIIHSDGSPTRSFCYTSDAILALLLMVFSEDPWQIFNIGNPDLEIDIYGLALIFAEIGNRYKWNGKILVRESEDSNYLINNPQRRVPNIDNIEKGLGWQPKIDLHTGIDRLINHQISDRLI